MHALEITDLSGDFREADTKLFRTQAGAKGHAAMLGTRGGYLEYRLDGKRFIPALGDGVHESPIGFRQNGNDYLYEAA